MLATQQVRRQAATMARALILAALTLALGYPVGQSANAQSRSTEGKGKAAEKALPAPTAAIENQLASIASAIEAPRTGPEAKATEKRAQDDLEAQQNMARYALWMFFATALTAVLTLAGILLIWRTLIHTRRASKYAGVGARQARRAAIASDLMAAEAAKATLAAVEANKAGQEANRLTLEAQRVARTTTRWEARKARQRERLADERAEAAYAIAKENADAATRHVEVALQTSYAQLRPWLKLEVKGNVFRRLSEAEDIASISVTITNAGASPALQAGVTMAVRLVCSTDDLGPIDLAQNLGMFAPIFSKDSPMPHECSYQPKHSDILAITEKARAVGAMPILVFDYKISYRAAFSEDIKETAFRYTIGGEFGDIEWLARTRKINEEILPRVECRRQPDDIMT
jgi:hypothetical protein